MKALIKHTLQKHKQEVETEFPAAKDKEDNGGNTNQNNSDETVVEFELVPTEEATEEMMEQEQEQVLTQDLQSLEKFNQASMLMEKTLVGEKWKETVFKLDA